MKSRGLVVIGLLAFVCVASWMAAGQQSAAVAPVAGAPVSAVPNLISYSGVLKDAGGRVLSGVTGVTFLLYKDEQGGAPLWLETQNVRPDSAGHYAVQLGARSAQGVPANMFQNGEARWLAVQVANESEQARVMLVAVPYAMKAGDAETIGGLPPSAFVLAAPPSAAGAGTANSGGVAAAVPPPASNVTTSGGTVGTMALWDTATDIKGSAVTQTGSGATAKVGINNASPSTTLDVGGGETVRGTLALPATGTATATVGKNSQPELFVASVFNSNTVTAVPQKFQWQAEPVNNNKSTASGTLNLLYASGTGVPAETGLKVANNGRITFAAGQVFPGTVKSVGSGAGLTGGPITSTGTLSIANAGVTNAMLLHPSLTVTAGTDLTGGGAVALGGSTTLNLDATKVPELAANNTFTGSTNTFSNVVQVNNEVFIPSIGGQAINATSASPSATTIFGEASSASGAAWGVEGITVSNAANAFGVFGSAEATSGNPIGVYGLATSSLTGIGVFGQNGVESATGTGALSNLIGKTVGVGAWGDGGSAIANVGVIGTADGGVAGLFASSSPSYYTLVAVGEDSNSFPFNAVNTANAKGCNIDPNGNLNCSGTKNAVVPIDGGARKVALSAIESPKNWFEDFGSAELVNGAAVIALDPDFIQTVNTGIDYKVFPVPNGDCNGLYVTNKTGTSFEVRELGGGTSDVRFDYRITALRRNYENVRFADHTHDPDLLKMLHRHGEAIGVRPQSHDPGKKLMPIPAKTARLKRLTAAPGR